MTMTSKASAGFTMLELILAIAITAVLVTFVYSVTQTMSATARRLEQAALQQAKRARFEEIARRDLRGWIPRKAANQKPSEPSSEMLSETKFTTTADSLTGSIGSGTALSRSATVQYIVRKSLDGYELDRIESTGDSASSMLTLIQSDVEPKIDFFDGKKWLTTWGSDNRPAAVRISLGVESIVTKL